QRAFVGGARLVHLAFVLVTDREIVEGGGVGRVELGGFLPSVNRFAPETALCDIDAEAHPLAGLAAVVGMHRRRRQECEKGKSRRKTLNHDGMTSTIATGLDRWQGICDGSDELVKQAMYRE